MSADPTKRPLPRANPADDTEVVPPVPSILEGRALSRPSSHRSRRAGYSATWLTLSALGLAGWLIYLARGDPALAWRALLVNFIFFTPLAAALVVWPATVMLSRGHWMDGMQRAGLAGLVMAPCSLVAFGVLCIGRSHWAGGLTAARLPLGAWFQPTFMMARDGLALALWWLVAWRFVVKARDSRPTVLAGWLAFLYAIVFSLIAFDMVMALDPHWASSLFAAYFFISAMYAAIAVLALHNALRAPHLPDLLHDLGKLVVTFSIMTTYLMFSQLLPIWYTNFEAETRFVVPRLSFAPWKFVSLALLGLVYLGPLVLLLPARAKRTPWRLGAVASLVLLGLWLERWWLIAPTLGQDARLSGADVAMAMVFAGVLGWGLHRSGPTRSGGDSHG